MHIMTAVLFCYEDGKETQAYQVMDSCNRKVGNGSLKKETELSMEVAPEKGLPGIV